MAVDPRRLVEFGRHLLSGDGHQPFDGSGDIIGNLSPFDQRGIEEKPQSLAVEHRRELVLVEVDETFLDSPRTIGHLVESYGLAVPQDGVSINLVEERRPGWEETIQEPLRDAAVCSEGLVWPVSPYSEKRSSACLRMRAQRRAKGNCLRDPLVSDLRFVLAFGPLA